ncbi:MAG: GntR family transcriptional regulator [Alcanivorax sp.]|nr:GntR family transcriptional regulator [Alcanivorax sp.]MAY10054.1 GntR family transcriptional regulator [Alcanivorax sp.]MBI54208.1 GntR family transcriptional regulator [Alcanivorax sp.]MBU57609.1 GntR family transcriptional regulator [Alcanivorax sp.]HCE41334.1 GntR family transcriptional regulator [Alcanivorax sp.]|tara:strand:- start:311 stop:694 length:384 start_codon:yes stop_codon:yes gene_type:complete
MQNADIGKLVLRLALGIMILLHGIHKLQHGVGGISGMVEGVGLPGFLAYGVFIGEVIAPIMVIIGYHTRIGAALMVGNMLVAIALAHLGDLFALGGMGGWALELQGMFLFSAVALCFLGSGRYAMKN